MPGPDTKDQVVCSVLGMQRLHSRTGSPCLNLNSTPACSSLQADSRPRAPRGFLAATILSGSTRTEEALLREGLNNERGLGAEAIARDLLEVLLHVREQSARVHRRGRAELEGEHGRAARARALLEGPRHLSHSWHGDSLACRTPTKPSATTRRIFSRPHLI